MIKTLSRSLRLAASMLVGALLTLPAVAQAPKPSAEAPAPPATVNPAPPATVTPAPPAAAAPAPTPLDQFAWLNGCWQGAVNQREFRELWLSPAGGMMIGVGQTVMRGKTIDVQYLRLELQSDGSINYVVVPNKQSETVFKLAVPGPEEFVFANHELDFPQKIVYRPGKEGWLYARAEGKVNGADKQVIYPMRHVDCHTGEFIRN